MHNAVVRSKVIYGLESIQLTESVKNRRDTFQLKGLRKILRMDATFVNPENTNESVFHAAEQEIQAEGKAYKRIAKLSQVYEANKLKLYAKSVTLGREAPGTEVAFAPDAVHTPHDHGKKRVGRPRQNWVVSTNKLFWSSYVRMQYDQIGTFEEFDPSKIIMSSWSKSKQGKLWNK